MRFSVLMSVYYKEKPEYLKLALDSIINQTLPVTEIVLIKDGPLTAELDKVVEQYAMEYIGLFRIFALEQNVGLGKALYYGVQQCKYDLIARMDTDDISLPNRFEMQVKEFIKNKELTLCGGQIAEFENDPEKITGYRQVPLTQTEIFKFAKKRNPFNHMTVMFKKQAVLNVGNYQDMPYFEDYWLWVRILQKGYAVKNIEQVLVKVRAGADMLVRRGGWNYVKASCKFLSVLHNANVTCLHEYLLMLVIRGSIAMLPFGLKNTLYSNVLRISGEKYDT
ncbi:glycosyltransferase [uncultured Phascolarctobacterium sp.]|uniref:glycosyltransferase n=1 Tax=uncultured Phascolarctobacterium sp. TaxID=512296 RepID=UPI0025D1D08B|nr:glycosyltransferase [uncultured Phascolarctobacterium sp.]